MHRENVNGPLTLSSSVFSGNKAQFGGGLWSFNVTAPMQVTSTVFQVRLRNHCVVVLGLHTEVGYKLRARGMAGSGMVDAMSRKPIVPIYACAPAGQPGSGQRRRLRVSRGNLLHAHSQSVAWPRRSESFMHCSDDRACVLTRAWQDSVLHRPSCGI